MRTSWIAMVAMVAPACGPAGESTDPCERLETRLETCGRKLPFAAAANLRMYCKISMRYEREPGDSPGNLAELTKGALAECAGPTAATCDGLKACFERHRCTFVLSGPDDVTPDFSCWPQPPSP